MNRITDFLKPPQQRAREAFAEAQREQCRVHDEATRAFREEAALRRERRRLRAAHYRADAETQFRIADHHRRCMEYHKRNARARLQAAREIEKEFEK